MCNISCDQLPDAQSRIVRGFHELLVRVYPNLRMLRGIAYSENDVTACLQQSTTLYGNDGAMVSEAEQEMQAFVQANQHSGLRTTMKGLLDHFEHKPYGWYLAAIQCTLAKLWARGKVEARRDGALLDETELGRALRNTNGYPNLVLEPQIEFTAAQVRQLRDFHADFFDGPPHANEAKALGQETATAFRALQQELVQLREKAETYPFLIALDAPLDCLGEMVDKPYTFYLTELHRHEDALFGLKEEVIDPVRRFMNGPQKQIYGEARRFLREQEPNLAYVEGAEAGQIRTVLADPACYRGNRIQQVKTLLDALRPKVEAKVQKEKEAALQTVDARWERLAGMAAYGELTSGQQAQLKQPFDELKRTVERQILIAVIRDTLRRFDLADYQRLLAQMAAWAQPAPTPGGTGGGTTFVAELHIEYVAQHTLAVDFDKVWLANERDVDDYLAALKRVLMQAILDGKRVQV